MSSKNNPRRVSRRRFLGQASCAAVGSATFFNSFLNMGMINALAKPFAPAPLTGDYRALVCILLAGGNDSFNMVVPTTSEPYNAYSITRSNLALPQGSLLPLNYTDPSGYQYGLHPSMPEVAGLFNDQKAAIMANVGTLRLPVTKQEVLNGTALLPLGLLSHSDQIRQWQTSLPQERTSKGWGGRMADILHTLNSNTEVSMNISLGGVNTFQTGNQIIEYGIQNTENGSVGIVMFDEQDPFNNLLGNAAQSVLEQQYTDIFKQTYRGKVLNAQAQHEAFAAAIAGVPPMPGFFNDENPMAKDLHMIARSIGAAASLGHTRQTYFLVYGGWDHHDEVLNNQEAMLAVVSQAMGQFNTALEAMNMNDCVTTFTISDFARTLTSNGNGTDHAWGGNAIVMGGAVNGGQIYGSYPDLALDNDLEVGGGILIPTTSADEYFAELALWMGVEPGDMEYILPNLAEFHDINDGQPLGFLNL